MKLKFYLLYIATLCITLCAKADDGARKHFNVGTNLPNPNLNPNFLGWPLGNTPSSPKSDIYHYDAAKNAWLPQPIVVPFKDETETANKFAFDPVRFTLRSSKDSVAANEEFTLTITADYLDVSPQLMFQFEGSSSYALKMLLPEGFVQTGGSYYDFISSMVDKQNPSQSYTITGYFEKQVPVPCFTLLRSHKGAGSGDSFVRRGNLCQFLKRNAFFKNNLKENLDINGNCDTFIELSIIF
jgi:hypothetical protein